jgi:hypothetical protein
MFARRRPPPSSWERAHRIADSLELGVAFKKGEIKLKRTRPASTLSVGAARYGNQ